MEAPIPNEGRIPGSVCAPVCGSIPGENPAAAEPLPQVLLNNLFESAPEGIVIQDDSGIVVRANQEFCRMFGYESDEVIGRSLNDLIAGDGILLDAVQLSRQENSGRFSVDTVRRRKDGSMIDVSIVGTTLNSDLAQGYVIYRDITARKRAEQALIESEAKFRAIADTASAAIYIHTGERFLFVNRATEAISGYSQNELLAINPFAIVHPDYRELIEENWKRRKERTPVRDTQEFRILTKSGEERWLDFSGSVIQFGGRDALLAIAFDITGRKRSEQLQAALYSIAARANEAQDLQALYASIHSSVAGLLYANNFSICLEDEGTGLLIRPYAVDEQDSLAARPKAKGLTEYVLRTGKPLLAGPELLRTLAEQGDVEPIGAPAVAWLGVPLKTGERPFGVLAIQSYTPGIGFERQDLEILTFVGQHVAAAIEHQRNLESIKLSEERYRSLFQRAAYGIYRGTLDGRIMEANPALATILGYESPAELTQLNLETDVYASAWDRRRLLSQFHKEERHIHEVRWKRKDGGLITVRLTAALAQCSNGEIEGYEVIVEDITECRDLEEQLRHAQKMEAVGRLAGGLAHDFNNLLTVIKGYSDLLLDQVPQADRARAQIEEIRKAADRAAALTSQLLAFGRRQMLAPRVLSLNQIVTSLEKMLRRLIGEDIELQTVLDPHLGNVKADIGQIEQVIMNLVVNARDAMPHGGHLIIDTGNVSVSSLSKSEQAALTPGNYVMLAVTDTGTGMDEDTRSHAFEPFFTTKPRGTGLGLATVYGIAKQSGGHAAIRSKQGAGTTIILYLPRVNDALDAHSPQPAENAGFGGKETILLVEDDDSLRLLVQQMLQKHGYTVLEADSSEGAMLLCERHRGPIQLLLADVVLRKDSGAELAARMLAGRPEMRVLYMSGHSHDTILNHGLPASGIPFVQKPFTEAEMSQKVREILDAVIP